VEATDKREKDPASTRVRTRRAVGIPPQGAGGVHGPPSSSRLAWQLAPRALPFPSAHHGTSSPPRETRVADPSPTGRPTWSVRKSKPTRTRHDQCDRPCTRIRPRTDPHPARARQKQNRLRPSHRATAGHK
jgi:hypothetical protein